MEAQQAKCWPTDLMVQPKGFHCTQPYIAWATPMTETLLKRTSKCKSSIHPLMYGYFTYNLILTKLL